MKTKEGGGEQTNNQGNPGEGQENSGTRKNTEDTTPW